MVEPSNLCGGSVLGAGLPWPSHRDPELSPRRPRESAAQLGGWPAESRLDRQATHLHEEGWFLRSGASPLRQEGFQRSTFICLRTLTPSSRMEAGNVRFYFLLGKTLDRLVWFDKIFTIES